MTLTKILNYSKTKILAAKLVFLTGADAHFVSISRDMSRYQNNNHLHCIVIAVLEVFQCMILKRAPFDNKNFFVRVTK